MVFENYLIPIVEDRKKYTGCYEVIEKFIANHRVVVGGSLAQTIASKLPRGIHDYEYELYCPNCRVAANNLVNELSMVMSTLYPEKICSMRSVIPHVKYVLYVDYRPMVTFNELAEEDVAMCSRDIGNKLVLLPELLLIDIYRGLYLPSRTRLWEQYADIENRIFKYLKSINDFGNKSGGIESDFSLSMRKKFLEFILEDKCANNDEVCVVGVFAILISKGINPGQDSGPLQLIAAKAHAFIKEVMQAIANLFPEMYMQKKVIYKYSKMWILGDYRIKRYVLKIAGREVMYIYNSAKYDLIPVVKIRGINVGNSLVLMRYNLIELWVLKSVASKGIVDSSFYEKRKKIYISNYLGLRHSLHSSPYTTDYIGTSLEDNMATKIHLSKGIRREGDYYPNAYLAEHGIYRSL